MKVKVFSVYQVNKYIKAIMDEDIILQGFFIRGEISNFKQHSSGHMYFTLKDDRAAMSCVMFKSHSENIAFLPENGLEVTVYGKVSLYEKTGQYQLYAEIMEPSGKGGLHLAFEQIRDRLEKEGLFKDEGKKALPLYPKTIAIITSPTGAAIADIINIAKRRNNRVKLVIAPVLVQGEGAPKDIAKAIAMVDKWGKADLMIVGRGGGSIEDLWAFNEEIVARAIYKAKTPIISAVGHETDFTIADFVADMRAPTPSAAAEIAVGDINALYYQLSNAKDLLNINMGNKIALSKQKLVSFTNSRALRQPLEIIYDHQIYLENMNKQLHRNFFTRININKISMENKVSRLEALSPLKVLKRGYSIVRDSEGRVISATEIYKGQTLNIEFYTGKAKVTVDTWEKDEREDDYGGKKEEL